jgi:hypothetical protein
LGYPDPDPGDQILHQSLRQSHKGRVRTKKTPGKPQQPPFAHRHGAAEYSAAGCPHGTVLKAAPHMGPLHVRSVARGDPIRKSPVEGWPIIPIRESKPAALYVVFLLPAKD